MNDASSPLNPMLRLTLAFTHARDAMYIMCLSTFSKRRYLTNQHAIIPPIMTSPAITSPAIRYIPCLLNILGAVLFMRVGYVVGFAGWNGTMILFGFSNLVAVLTALSFSAIVTNGKMGGGGVYFMIARSMGPAFGGATGLLFYLCYCINSAFNATAMVDDISKVVFHEPEPWHFPAL